MKWQALCEGASADELKRVALELVRSLDEVTSEPPVVSHEVATLYYYADDVFPDQGFAERCSEHIGRTIELMSGRSGPGLFGGFTGAAWAIEHTHPSALDDEDGDGLVGLDQALHEVLAAGPWEGEYDLISGLVGFAVYALERGPRPDARACLRLIVDQLVALAHPQANGVAWWTRPDVLNGPGHYNLGVAHGVPGVVAALAQICVIPELADRARPLLEGAVGWLLKQRRPPDRNVAFAYDTTADVPARSAWCYGDPGIAATLVLAGRLAGDPSWERVGIEIGLRAAERPFAETGVEDAGICHGAAGLSHIYNRLFQATGNSAFAEAARTWLAHTLAIRRPGVGLSGYLSKNPAGPGQELTWGPDPSFLTGIIGIALVMIAAVADAEPNWDRCLLCAIPPQR
jgi:hypothetical protein